MDCEHFNPLAALDGIDQEAVEHSRSCLNCRREMLELKKVVSVAEQAFRERLIEESEEAEEAGPEPLPAAVAKKVAALRRKTLVERLRQKFDMTLEAAGSLVDRMTRGEAVPEPMAASLKKMIEPGDEELEVDREEEEGEEKETGDEPGGKGVDDGPE